MWYHIVLALSSLYFFLKLSLVGELFTSAGILFHSSITRIGTKEVFSQFQSPMFDLDVEWVGTTAGISASPSGHFKEVVLVQLVFPLSLFYTPFACLPGAAFLLGKIDSTPFNLGWTP